MKNKCVSCGREFNSLFKINLCKDCSDKRTIQRPYQANHTFYAKLNETQILHMNFWNVMVWVNRKTQNLKELRKILKSSKYINNVLKAYGWKTNSVAKKPLEETKNRFVASMKSFFELRKKGFVDAKTPSYTKDIKDFPVIFRQNFGKIKMGEKYTYITLPFLGRIRIKLDYSLDFKTIKQVTVNRFRVFITFEKIVEQKEERMILYYDDIKPKTMENKKNMDTGYALFNQRLLNIAKRMGGITCIAVNPAYTSKPHKNIPKSDFLNHALSSQLIWQRGGSNPLAISYDFNQRFLAVCEGGNLPDEKHGKFSFPLIYEKNEEKVKKLSRLLSRKQKGSQNWKDTKKKLGELHRKIMAERKRSQEAVIHQLINRGIIHYRTQKQADYLYKGLSN